jgi:hypothetical protein
MGARQPIALATSCYPVNLGVVLGRAGRLAARVHHGLAGTPLQGFGIVRWGGGIVNLNVFAGCG